MKHMNGFIFITELQAEDLRLRVKRRRCTNPCKKQSQKNLCFGEQGQIILQITTIHKKRLMVR
jgi:hypothetical protein